MALNTSVKILKLMVFNGMGPFNGINGILAFLELVVFHGMVISNKVNSIKWYLTELTIEVNFFCFFINPSN